MPYFCWIYRASPSSATKNIINLISVLTVYWCSCVELSCVVGKGCLLWSGYSLDKTLLSFALLYSVLYGQTCLSFWISLDFLLLCSNPLWWKGYLFLVLVLEVLVGLHRNSQLQILRPQWLGHKLGLLWCWMLCLGNEPRELCHFWDCTPVPHFWLLLTVRATQFLLRDSCPQ